MAMLEKFIKQPADNLDYDIEYADWIDDGDSLASAVVVVSPTGLTVQSPVLVGTKFKLWVSGGTAGVSYKVTVTSTTTLGRIKQDEILIRVKDY